MPSAGEDNPDEDGTRDEDAFDLDALDSDLSKMESQLRDRRDLIRLGIELRAKYQLETDEEDIIVPPLIADYVRRVVSESANMSRQKRDYLLQDELVNFQARTSRYHFPNGDVLHTGPEEVVLRYPAEDPSHSA